MPAQSAKCPYCQQPTELRVATVFENGEAFHYLCAMLWRRGEAARAARTTSAA